MCYHFALVATKEELEKRFKATTPPEVPAEPQYHVNAYSYPNMPILTHQQPDQFRGIRWGLVPHWTKTKADADKLRAQTINARSETIYEKPSFRGAAQKGQRCIIPITGFYEWHTVGKAKYPFYISSTAQPIVGIAGLWDEWADPDTGEVLTTYTMLTTDANPLLAKIHNTKQRQPCLMNPEQERTWLHENLGQTEVQQLLHEIYPADRMTSHPISKLITSRTENSNVPAVMAEATYPGIGIMN